MTGTAENFWMKKAAGKRERERERERESGRRRSGSYRDSRRRKKPFLLFS